MSADVGLERVLFPIANDSGAEFTATLQNSHDRNLVFGASLSNPALALVGVHESCCAADESLIHFHFAPRAAHWNGRARLHGETDSVQHEPCALLSNSKSAANFVRANTILAVGNQPDCDEPLVERERGIFEDSSNLHAELLASMLVLALPETASGDEANVSSAASWALDTVRPAALDHELEAVVGVGEVQNGLLQSLWLFHGVSHWSKYPRNALLSQVYYCLCKCSFQRSYGILAVDREEGGTP